jgi:3-oxocholest-4-en-26-oyl-CoA dehydrogenase beta subunit
VDFSYSDEQLALRQLAARLFAERSADESRKSFARSGAAYDASLWSSLADAGLLGTAIGTRHGGSGLGLTELALLLEQQGRALAAVPLLPTLVLGALALEKFGSAVQQALLPGVASGSVLLTAALQEPAGTQPSEPTTTATSIAGGWRLTGEKVCVPYGLQAQRILLSARASEGARLFLIEPHCAGVRIEGQISTSGEPQARVSLAGAEVSAADAVGGPEPSAVTWVVARAQLGYAALQLGVLEEALQRAVNYVSERHQFGRPIGSFQAVQHRLADCYIDIEALRSVYLRALWALEQEQEAAAEVLAAKWWSARAGHRVSHAVQHVHGGLGADMEYPIHAFFLRATELSLALGGGAPALTRIGAELAGGRVAAFTQ